jgi:2,3-bisphosphoglycerate-dependent phosphoglycerate mutase
MAELSEPARIMTQDLVDTSTVWLIRHGQSHANAGIATDHPSTIELTDLGREQAAAIARKIQSVPDRIVISPYRRTLHTAKPTLGKFEKQGATVQVVEWPIQEFTYLNPVRCRGTTAVDRQSWAKEYWQRADPEWEDGDGAESYSHLMLRVGQFADRLASQKGFAIVFGHGMFFKAFLISLQYGTSGTPEAMSRYRTLESANPIRNAEIVELTRKHGGEWIIKGTPQNGA